MKDLTNKRVAILVGNGFEQIEFTEPRRALQDAGVEAVVVSLKKEPVYGFNHHDRADRFEVDQSLDDADPGEFDALLIPGGVLSPDELRMDERAIRFTRAFFTARKPVFAICHGPQLLISTGVVEGRTLTSWPGVRIDLENAGAQWRDEAVVVDQGLVTSRKPDDLPQFCAKMLEELAEGIHDRPRPGQGKSEGIRPGM